MGLARPAPFLTVASWVLYDLANTVFSMGVVSLYFPSWVRGVVGPDRVDSVVGVVTAISMGLIFIVSPLLGAMSDRARRRMPFLVVSTIACVLCTLLLARIGYWGTMVAFVLANAAFQAGLQFYDSLLVEVTTDDNRGRIGGVGVGVGYVGSYVALSFSLLFGVKDHIVLFTLVGIAFLAFAVPCFFFVRERGNPNPSKVFDAKVIAATTRETIRTLREGDRYPGLIRFLVGRIFYTDAINTVITVMTLFTINVAEHSGLNADTAETTKGLVMLTAITFAIPGGFMWGRVVDRIGPKRTLDVVLCLWMGVFLLASAIGVLGLGLPALYLVASLAGIGLGGIWSADRPLMLRLTPPDRVGEFYGLYGMVGRFSAILGPLLWAGVMWVAVDQVGLARLTGQGVSLAVLMLMIIVSWRILRRVDDAPRDWGALANRPLP
jgi:UMF1 family MFS transporter